MNYELSKCYTFCRTDQGAFSTLYTIGVQIACLVPLAVIGRKLHRTETGTALALETAGTGNVDAGIGLGQRLMLRSYPA